MIKRVLLLKFVSWVVLSPVFALAPIQNVRLKATPIFQTLCESGSFELHYRRASSGLGGCCASSRLSLLTLAENAKLGQPLRWRGRE
jgi:hypothetical protein